MLFLIYNFFTRANYLSGLGTLKLAVPRSSSRQVRGKNYYRVTFFKRILLLGNWLNTIHHRSRFQCPQNERFQFQFEQSTCGVIYCSGFSRVPGRMWPPRLERTSGKPVLTYTLGYWLESLSLSSLIRPYMYITGDAAMKLRLDL